MVRAWRPISRRDFTTADTEDTEGKMRRSSRSLDSVFSASIVVNFFLRAEGRRRGNGRPLRRANRKSCPAGAATEWCVGARRRARRSGRRVAGRGDGRSESRAVPGGRARPRNDHPGKAASRRAIPRSHRPAGTRSTPRPPADGRPGRAPRPSWWALAPGPASDRNPRRRRSQGPTSRGRVAIRKRAAGYASTGRHRGEIASPSHRDQSRVSELRSKASPGPLASVTGRIREKMPPRRPCPG